MHLNDLGFPSTLTQAVIDDKSLIIYRPRLNQITGSVLSTILLQQIIYWASKSSNLFYKFMRPCNHDLYKPGDSWEEELGFTRRELDGSLKNIAAKYNPKRDNIPEDSLVVYYTDIRRLTWYSVNWKRLNSAIEQVFIRNVQNEHYVKPDSCITYSENRTLLYNDTETTTKTKQQTSPVASHTEATIPKQEDVNAAAVSLFEKYAISHDKAFLFANKFTRAFIERKLKEIELKFLGGSIKNLQGYIITVFEKSVTEDSVFEQGQNAKQELTKQQQKEAQIIAKKKEQQEERKHHEYISITDKLMNEANVVELRWFAEWLATESMQVLSVYKEQGLKSCIVMAYYRRFLYNKYYKLDTGD